jgi:hypothetical protein
MAAFYSGMAVLGVIVAIATLILEGADALPLPLIFTFFFLSMGNTELLRERIAEREVARASVPVATRSGEILVRKGRACLERGVQAVDGRLYLTSDRLIFESDPNDSVSSIFGSNVWTGILCISLRDVVRSEKCWTSFLGLVPLLPKCIAVETANGQTARIRVGGRAGWLDAIEATRQQQESA